MELPTINLLQEPPWPARWLIPYLPRSSDLWSGRFLQEIERVMADALPWFRFWHRWLSDDDLSALSPADRWAWVALRGHVAMHGENGKAEIDPKNAVLAACIGVSPDQLAVTLARLPRLQIAENPDNGKLSLSYAKWFSEQSDPTAYERVRRSRARPDQTRADQIRPETTTPRTLRVRKSITERDEVFEQFWQGYPRKKNKGDAEKAWKALRPSEPLVVRILAAVAAQRRCFDWLKDGGKWIPYPASWLRAKAWEDAVDTRLDDELPPAI